MVFLLDFTRVTPMERLILVAEIATRFGANPAQVEAEIRDKGLPILAIDVAVEWRTN